MACINYPTNSDIEYIYESTACIDDDIYNYQKETAHQIGEVLKSGIDTIIAERRGDISKIEGANKKGTYIHERFNELVREQMEKIGFVEGKDYTLAEPFQREIDIQIHFCATQLDLKPADKSGNEGGIFNQYGRDKEIRDLSKIKDINDKEKYYFDHGKYYQYGQLHRYDEKLAKNGNSYDTYVITYDKPW